MNDFLKIFIKTLKYIDINLKNISLYEEDLNVITNNEMKHIIVFSKTNINEKLILEDILSSKDNKSISINTNISFPETQEEIMKNEGFSVFLEKMKKLTTVSMIIHSINKYKYKQEDFLNQKKSFDLSFKKLVNNSNQLKKMNELKKTNNNINDNIKELEMIIKTIGIKEI